jgi:murein L,D-transpeptidase YafK
MNAMNTGRSVRASVYLRALMAVVALLFFGTLTVGHMAQAGTVTPPVPGPLVKADRILVLKRARKLELLRNGVVMKVYPIALGPSPIGTKHSAGDGKTPEGVYTIDALQPHSEYHLALHVSYPNVADKAQAAAYHRDPGGDIMIHGLPNWYHGADPVKFDRDWTKGCVSVGDKAIEEIYAAVDIGTVIEIRP